MKRLKYGIVGAGFVGPHHIDAVRRLGFVEVVALAGTNLERARRKAAQLFVPRAYGSFEELVADPEIDVVDIATPTWLHHRIALAAIAARKHVIVDKPMATTAVEARQMLEAAREAGVVNAVTFNYRYNPVVQHARVLIRRGDAGQVRFVHGHYLQEWLLHDTDFSWRLEPEKAGPACVVGDAGAHWFDLAQYLTGRRIKSVLADLTTAVKIRKRLLSEQHDTFEENSSGATEDFSVKVDDLSSVLLRFDNGAPGNFFGCQLCAGHKNDLRIEINGSRCSLAWEQERPDELWIGRRGASNETLLKDPAVLDSSVRHYASLPGGHNEAWPDAFRNLMRNILTFIAEERDPASADGELFPTFETGYRVAAIVDAVIRSQEQGSRWVEVNYR
jgi:predicted dehydrogenase